MTPEERSDLISERDELILRIKVFEESLKELQALGNQVFQFQVHMKNELIALQLTLAYADHDAAKENQVYVDVGTVAS